MHKLLLSFFLLISLSSTAQEEVDFTLVHNDLVRSYKLYIPASYSAESAAPLVFNFHGYGSNAFEQMWYGDFRSIADTAGFLIAHPQGTELDGITHWNVGGWTLESTVDDVGFTEAMIDSIGENYTIDPQRIYATGMSNGGYMSFLLACQLSNRIAAVASVTGSMTPETMTACAPIHPTPIMQIHGTADGTVPYDGEFWTEPIPEVLNYWVNYNNCDPTPTITALPDINTSDGCTAEHYVYAGGDNGTAVEHYKIIDGQHTWPGTFFTSAGTNEDFSASVEIWRFFSQYDLNGAINPVHINAQEKLALHSIYPNPASHIISLQQPPSQPLDATLTSLSGKTVWSGKLSSNSYSIDVSNLESGLYFLRIADSVMKLVVAH